MSGVENLKKTYPELLSHMECDGYAASYVAQVRREAERIVRCCEESGRCSYEDVYEGYRTAGRPAAWLASKRTMIRLIEQFDVHGRLPDGSHHGELFVEKTYSRLLPVFKAVVDCYAEAARARGKQESTVAVESSSGATFFFALQEKGCPDPAAVTEKAVLEVFTGADGAPAKSSSYRRNVAAVLKGAAPAFPELSQVAAFLPALRRARRNIQYLTDDEAAAVKAALRGANGLSLRDRAVGTLALHTGMRGCDIAAMRADAVDWSAEVITVDQSKTGRQLTLPLSAVVGNAVWDYATLERPNTGCAYLFISNNRPRGPLSRSAMGGIAARIMDTAGIRLRAGDRRGFHLFRHRLATALLGNGVPRPVVSETLGHSSPASLDAYLSADLAHLRECAISVEPFPVAAEVFSNA